MKTLVLSFLISGQVVLACSGEKAKQTLCEGLSLFYDGQNKAAITAFSRYIELSPEDPIGYWRKLLSEYFLAREAAKTDTPTFKPEAYQALVKLGNDGVAKAEIKISNGENVDFNRYVEASIVSLLAAIQYKNESMWISLATIKKAVRIAEQSSCPEAGFLLGSINYETSKHSFIVRMILGLPHDRNEGRAMILAAVQHNTSPFVDDIWFMIFSIEKEEHSQYSKTEVKKIWRDLHARHPDNRMLNSFEARFK